MGADRPAILMLDQESIRRRIADAPKSPGLTQDRLTLLVPRSKNLISQVERVFKPATPSFVAAVVKALHIDVPHPGQVAT